MPQPVPSFADKALVMTPTGLQGYARAENKHELPHPVYCFFSSEKYVRGSTWEQVTLAWDDFDENRIEVYGADKPMCSFEPVLNFSTRKGSMPHDPELGFQVGAGIFNPCFWVQCCPYIIPHYARIEIPGRGKHHGRAVQVIGLSREHGDPQQVRSLIQKAASGHKAAGVRAAAAKPRLD